MRNPKPQDPHISRSGYMDHIGPKRLNLSEHPISISVEKRIAIEVMVEGKRSESTFQFQCSKRHFLTYVGSRTRVYAKERGLPPLGKRRQLTAQRAHTVRFTEGIREQRNSQRPRQLPVPQ